MDVGVDPGGVVDRCWSVSHRSKPARRPRRRPPATDPATVVRRGGGRVVAGTRRGRRIDLPPEITTRTTGDRVREATFNALESLDVLDGARACDAFAGSGALGIEALSRGATHVTFTERDPVARGVLEANLASLDLASQATVVPGDGAGVIAVGGPWDLVLLDPPYAFDGWPDLLAATASRLAPAGVVVVESDREVDVGPLLHPRRAKRYGGTVVTFASATGAAS